MASGKRASMREGPLTALFRRTDLDEEESAGEAAPSGARPPEAESERRERERPVRERDEQLAAPRSEAARRAYEADREEIRVQRATPAARLPTPRERLRHAFSADLAEDVVETAPAAVEEPATDAPRGPAPVRAPIGSPSLRVVGVGGAGVNAVNRMVEAEVAGVEFIALNTDLQSLEHSDAHVTLHIGDRVTRGLGSGSDPELGRQAAMEEYDKVKALLKGSDMVFIAAGSGGGTGTGGAPVVARIAREVGALTVAIVTEPFGFEGSRRREQALKGIEALTGEVDTLIVVPNDRLLSVLDRRTSMMEAFRVADDVLRQGVQGISDLVNLPGLINLDFADVRTIMSEAGNALLGIGMGHGERRALDAAEKAVASPLLDTSVEGAHSILLSITGGPDLSLWEVNEAARAVAEAAHPEANIIFGAMLDEKLEDEVWVTVVATGYRERSTGNARRTRGATGGRERRAVPEASRREPADSRARVGEPRRTGRRGPDYDVPEFFPRDY